MLERFKNFIKEKKLFGSRHTLLLAVSGGLDSTVMACLCKMAGFDFGIAHCNFSMRGKESDEDEQFVRRMALEYGVDFYARSFDTKAIAKVQKKSIQVCARELRYQWFEEIRQQAGYDLILMAHHQDDQVETFFINLLRGTGIAGLHGIPVQRDKIVRPLLFATRSEIEKFAGENRLHYREDSSNRSLNYVRNKLRHKVIPVLKELNPGIESAMVKTIAHLQQVEQVFKRTMKKQLESLKQASPSPAHSVGLKGAIVLDLATLLKLEPLSLYLHELLSPYGFNEAMCQDIGRVLGTKGSGRQFFSSTHRLVKNRSKLLLVRIESPAQGEFLIPAGVIKLTRPFTLRISKKNADTFRIPPSPEVACTDMAKLHFPLILRKWNKGDVFMPLGMKTRKKLSDYFTDLKFSLPEKENTWLLLSGGDIVWVIGHRLDERYKVTEQTKVMCIFKL